MENITATFETAYVGSRYGFNHECVVTTSEGKTAKAICHYYNRTWEPYPFYTVKQCAIDKLVHQEVEADCEEYKATHKCNRLPRGYRKACEKIYREKYREIIEKIRRY